MVCTLYRVSGWPVIGWFWSKREVEYCIKLNVAADVSPRRRLGKYGGMGQRSSRGFPLDETPNVAALL